MGARIVIWFVLLVACARFLIDTSHFSVPRPNRNELVSPTEESPLKFPTLSRLGQKLLSDQPASNDWERELYHRLDIVREACGDLCAINDLVALEKYTVPPNATYNYSTPLYRSLKVPVDCDAIVMNEEMDAGDSSIQIVPPQALREFYTMNGLVELRYDNDTEESSNELNENYMGGSSAVAVWTRDMIEAQRKKTLRRLPLGKPVATYGKQPNHFLESIKRNIPSFAGSRVLVIGTEFPWLEAACLALGASHVTTLEYGKIKSEHPQISTLLPSEVRELWKTKQLEPFDVVASFSSIEHPGLGRYGDALNPWGDVLSIARARCMTKPGGYLAIGVPARFRRDLVNFYLYRSYGPARLPLLSANWYPVDGQDHINAPIRRFRHSSYVFRNLE